MKNNTYHIPVLVEQLLNNFQLDQNSVIIDGTIGFGGHAGEILSQYPTATYIGFDKDIMAINYTMKQYQEYEKLSIVNQPFSSIPQYITKHNIQPSHILLDLGVSSYQIDQSNRGFTFQKDEPLDMRMNMDEQLSASDVLNTYSKDELMVLFKDEGDIRFPDKLVKTIIEFRSDTLFATTHDLVACAKRSFYFKSRRHYISMLTKIFQAIRVEVNQEMSELSNILNDLLKMSAKIIVGIITFQPNEDRLLKTFIKENKLEQVAKKPFRLSYNECKGNPRAKSASLRIFIV